MVNPNRIKYNGIFSNELNMPDLIMDCAFDSDNSGSAHFLQEKPSLLSLMTAEIEE